jgi:hypothetical protein
MISFALSLKNPCNRVLALREVQIPDRVLSSSQRMISFALSLKRLDIVSL